MTNGPRSVASCNDGLVLIDLVSRAQTIKRPADWEAHKPAVPPSRLSAVDTRPSRDRCSTVSGELDTRAGLVFRST